MFQSCNKLVGGCGTTYDSNYTDKTYARIDHGTDQPGYFTGVFKLTLPTNVSASPDPIFLQSSDRYYAVDTIVTLTYTGNMPEGYAPVYTVNGTAIEGNTFQMPLGDATVTVEIKSTRYTYDSTTGELTLLRGEFNRDDKWGDEVVANAVTSVTATNMVSFTGDCTELFQGFTNCTSMDLNNVNTSNATSMRNLFTGCVSLTTLDLSNWDTGNVTDMYCMFLQCIRLDSLNLSNFNTAKVTNMALMFDNCKKHKSLNVSGWDTGNVTEMYNLFCSCSSLKTLDLSGWSAGKVNTMTSMFAACDSLTTIYADRDWNIGGNANSNGMFGICYSLVGGKGTTYDQNHIDAEYARIDGGPDCPGYFTASNPVVVVPGDVDGDGFVTSVDVTCVYNYLLNNDMTFFDTCDVDNDGSITAGDITFIYNILLGNKK